MSLPNFKTPFYGIVCHTEKPGRACIGKSVVSYVVFGSAQERAAWLKQDTKHHRIIEPGHLFGPGYFDNGCGIGYLDPFRPESIDWKTGTPHNGDTMKPTNEEKLIALATEVGLARSVEILKEMQADPKRVSMSDVVAVKRKRKVLYPSP